MSIDFGIFEIDIFGEVEIPEFEISEVEISEVEISEVEIPEVEISEVEIPDVEIFGVEIPGVEIPDIEIPEVEIPEVEISEVEIPDIEISDLAANIISDTTVRILVGGSLSGRDTLSGEPGTDLFILGGSEINSDFTIEGDPTPTNYYDGAGNDDYALITDFNKSEDIIQLAGSRNDYILGASPTGLPEGIGIYQSEELIAIVQGDTDLNLSADYFQYSIV